MGRAARYTLSVMAWVAAYAGWSSIIGLVVAALTGDRPRAVSQGMSALLTVIGPLVPTLVALWFNDWARDGFPSRDQQRAAQGGAAAGPDRASPVEEPAALPDAAGTETAGTEHAAPAPAPPVLVAPPVDLLSPFPPAMAPPVAPAPRTVAAHPLGVPGTPAAHAPAGAFPVAPLLRDRD